MARYNRKNRGGWGYFLELIIIVIGITVSFLLNEWRESKRLEEKKHHLVYDINKDLRTDSLVLEQAVRFYTLMVKSHDSLLLDRNRIIEEDSLNVNLDHFVSYYPFNESATTYKRILTDQEVTIDKEDSLIQYYMNLHNLVYPSLHEWLFIEKDFVLNIALPYMDENAPFVYPTPQGKSFDGSVFYELRKQDTFMNYLKSGRLYKQSMINVLNGVLRYVKYIKAQTNQYIAEEKKKKKA